MYHLLAHLHCCIRALDCSQFQQTRICLRPVPRPLTNVPFLPSWDAFRPPHLRRTGGGDGQKNDRECDVLFLNYPAPRGATRRSAALLLCPCASALSRVKETVLSSRPIRPVPSNSGDPLYSPFLRRASPVCVCVCAKTTQHTDNNRGHALAPPPPLFTSSQQPPLLFLKTTMMPSGGGYRRGVHLFRFLIP